MGNEKIELRLGEKEYVVSKYLNDGYGNGLYITNKRVIYQTGYQNTLNIKDLYINKITMIDAGNITEKKKVGGPLILLLLGLSILIMSIYYGKVYDFETIGIIISILMILLSFVLLVTIKGASNSSIKFIAENGSLSLNLSHKEYIDDIRKTITDIKDGIYENIEMEKTEEEVK